MLIFDESKLTQELSALPVKHRIAFAASCCERLLPNYRAFAVMEHWGDPNLLEQALDEVWKFLEEDSLSEGHVRELIHAGEAVIPDTEDFTSLFAGAALNAASAVLYTLECCLDGDPERAALVGRLAINTIEAYLHIVNDPDTEVHAADSALDEWIQQAPMMTAEVEKQRQDVELLKYQTGLDSDLLHSLRRASGLMGIQPFARGLVCMKDP